TKFRETILYLRFYLRRFGFSNAMLENLPEILQGESGKQIHSPSHRLLRDREKLILTPLQAHEILQKLLIEEIEKVEEFSDGKSAAEVDGDLLTLPLQLRTWKAGDKMIPLGMQGHRNVSDVLNELKLPAHEKEKKEIVVSGDEIVWVPGYRIADKFKVTDKTRRMLRLRLV
ncbi:MAG TPA: tRNA lysidine(34) synthetase TilS, partial [Bacteroidia bacterium]|nr:tRNA lysidine(34) synthetase TilS [Bacteroidia bacterium]